MYFRTLDFTLVPLPQMQLKIQGLYHRCNSKYKASTTDATQNTRHYESLEAGLHTVRPRLPEAGWRHGPSGAQRMALLLAHPVVGAGSMGSTSPGLAYTDHCPRMGSRSIRHGGLPQLSVEGCPYRSEKPKLCSTWMLPCVVKPSQSWKIDDLNPIWVRLLAVFDFS